MEPMLMTRAGSSAVAAFSSIGRRSRVRKKSDFRLRSVILSKPFSGKVSIASPHAAPALLTRMWSLLLALGNLPNEVIDPLHGREIGRQRNAAPDRRQLLGHRIADLGGARTDVDGGAGLDIAAGNHQADAARAAGHEGDLATDRKEGRNTVVVIHWAPPCHRLRRSGEAADPEIQIAEARVLGLAVVGAVVDLLHDPGQIGRGRSSSRS